MMNTTRRASVLVLAIGMLCSTLSQAMMERAQSVYSNLTLKNAAIAATAAAAFTFWFREPTNDDDRYRSDELLLGVDFAKNGYYFVVDGLIGHPGKNVFLTAKEDEGGKIEVGSTVKVKPRGVGGWIHANYKKILSALGTVMFLKLVSESAAESARGERSFADVFIDRLDTYVKKLKIHKLSDIGIPLAAGCVGYAIGA